MNRVTFAVADGTAVCPFDGEPYRYAATLTLKRPARIVRIEAVAAWVEEQRTREVTAEALARGLADFGRDAGSCRAVAVVTHEERDGVTLTVRAVAR